MVLLAHNRTNSRPGAINTLAGLDNRKGYLPMSAPIVAHPQQAPSVKPQPALTAGTRVTVRTSDSFDGMGGEVLSVHYHPVKPFAFVAMDKAHYSHMALYFDCDELEVSS